MGLGDVGGVAVIRRQVCPKRHAGAEGVQSTTRFSIHRAT